MPRPTRRACGLFVLWMGALAAACNESYSVTSAIPTAPSPVSPGAGSLARGPSLLLGPATLSAPQPFPPRQDSLSFRLELEQVYRAELGRAGAATFLDVEGDAIWMQEYMRYRVYACGHLDAVQRVFDQIDRGVIAPACGAVSGSQVVFPPFQDSLDFRQRLEAKYRDGLRRSPTTSFVDAEGAIVWLQAYLRYRIFACDDAAARAAVRTMIRGGTAP